MSRKGLEEYRQRVQSGEIEPVKRKNPATKFAERETRKTAIDAFCWECMGELREEIRNCTATHCPLYNFRPYK